MAEYGPDVVVGGAADDPGDSPSRFELAVSRQFPAFLAAQNISLAFTTYQSAKLFLLGHRPGPGEGNDGDEPKISVFERTFNRCMGLVADAQAETLYMSTLYQLWRFGSAFERGNYQGYDRMYVPQVGYTTADLDIHDIGIDRDGHPVFVNTLFSCLATVSQAHSFKPVWQPPWISRLAAEDRCHLNGLAMQDGQPAWVTAVAATDIQDGWREHRLEGGVVCDTRNNEIVARGLSMPHSPRWYQDRLWLLESGTGYFGYVDLASGRFERVAFCPGFTRGLAFSDHYAIVGMSNSRNKHEFGGLPLDDHLKKEGIEPRCGLAVIDLTTGDLVHSVTLGGIVEELYDVVVLPGVRRPMALGFKTDEIRRVISIEEIP